MESIEARALTERFRKLTAVDETTVDIKQGRITGFIGPNGAGKTTTLRMILGLVRPTAGRVTIEGAPTGVSVRHGRPSVLCWSYPGSIPAARHVPIWASSLVQRVSSNPGWMRFSSSWG